MAKTQSSLKGGHESENKPVRKSDPGESATKQAVYETAIRLFAKNGFAATGMRQLSREAGVNLATVNYFYGSKKGLLEAILDDYFTGLLGVLTEKLAGGEAPEVKLRRSVGAVAKYFSANSDKLIIAITELPHDDPEIIDFKAQRFRRLSKLIQENLGGETPLPVTLMAPAIVGLAASRYLFRPVLEKVLAPDDLARETEAFPDFIAGFTMDGAGALLAAQDKGDGND